MGLDMYFYAEKEIDTSPLGLQLATPLEKHGQDCWDGDATYDYISGWEFSKDARFEPAVKLAGFGPDAGSPHICACPHALQVCAAYWRKANQIHSWFVGECGGGVDECQHIPVSHVQLGQLVLLCRKALKDKDPELLEPRSGFFFGSTDIDEWYWKDIEETIKMLAPLAEFPGPMHYRASW